MKFIEGAYGSLRGDDKAFIGKILKATDQRPRRADRKALCDVQTEGTTPHLLLSLLEYIEQLDGISCKLRESVSALKCVLEEHVDTGACLKSLYADEIATRKYQSRSNVFRCTGSTLLVKGLEFDHAVILRGQSWGGSKDLYVALTRGSKSVTLLDLISVS
jgi:DNA helicase-2/ATP-dependent DNA helicase PcrA